MSDAEAESRKGEENPGHRIDRGQLRSGSDEKTFLKNLKHEITACGRKVKLGTSADVQNGNSLTSIDCHSERSEAIS